MGSMIGPITLTVGQPYKVQLAQDTAYIELQNDSLYDVWVFFGEVEPTDTTNANNTWHRVVRRQHNGVLPVEGYRGASAAERRNNTIGAFRGVVWLLAVNPGGLALTGTVSGRSQVYLTPYAQGDGLPAHSSLSTQTDLTSQPRIVTVPIAMLQWANRTWDANTNLNNTLEVLTIPTVLLANGIFNVYLYYADFQVLGTGQIVFRLVCQPRDNTHSDLGSAVTLYEGVASADSTSHVGNHARFTSPYPFCVHFENGGGVSIPVGTTELAINMVYIGGDKPQVAVNVAANLDSTNATPLVEIGNFGLWFKGGTSAPSY